jgi:UDP-N-acetylglucosamine 2-epimerase
MKTVMLVFGTRNVAIKNVPTNQRAEDSEYIIIVKCWIRFWMRFR